jgi:hypothetical protein
MAHHSPIFSANGPPSSPFGGTKVGINSAGTSHIPPPSAMGPRAITKSKQHPCSRFYCMFCLQLQHTHRPGPSKLHMPRSFLDISAGTLGMCSTWRHRALRNMSRTMKSSNSSAMTPKSTRIARCLLSSEHLQPTSLSPRRSTTRVDLSSLFSQHAQSKHHSSHHPQVSAITTSSHTSTTPSQCSQSSVLSLPFLRPDNISKLQAPVFHGIVL